MVTDVAVCCIYHKPRAFGESSDESSSSSSSDEDSSDNNDDEQARWTNQNRRNQPRNSNEHGDREDIPNGGEPCAKHATSKRVQRQQQKKTKRRPNAYERVPKYGKTKEEQEQKEEEPSNGEGPKGK
jgi:protein phosphatase 1 regulatory subunit 11